MPKDTKIIELNRPLEPEPDTPSNRLAEAHWMARRAIVNITAALEDLELSIGAIRRVLAIVEASLRDAD